MEEVGELEESSKDGSEKQFSSDTNESGISEDMNVVDMNVSCDNNSLEQTNGKTSSEGAQASSPENETENQLSSKASMLVNHSSMDELEDVSLNCSGMKKDDSGIYSEKSPISSALKSVSDGDLTESITESFEENASLEQKCKGNSGSNDGDVSLESDPIVADCNGEFTETDDQRSGQTKHNDNVNTNNSKAMDEKTDHETVNNKIVKPKVLKADDISDSDVKDDSDVTKATGSKRTKHLVDYESSDSEEESDSDASDRHGKVEKPRKCFRKRKSISSDDSDVESGDNDDDSVANSDGTPVLLRHGGLEDVVRMSDLDSDDSSDDSEAKVETKNDSSESEPDDAPVELSRFGPPRHKWKALFDLRQRECGYSVRKDSGYFRKKIQGSLQMVQRFDLQYKMDQHEGCVNALNFNSHGTLLASGSDDLNIVIWDWIRNKPQLIYDSGHRSNVFQSKFMPFSGDCHVVSCARDGQIRLADLSSTGVCKGTKKLAQHKGAAHKLALEMDSPHVFLSCGEDAITYEIDLRCDKPNKLVLTKENDRKVAQYSIHSNPCNSNEFIVSGRDHFIRMYDKRKIDGDEDDGLVKKFCPHHLSTGDKPDMKANVTCACYNYNGTEVLGTYNDEDIYLFSNAHSDGANYIHKYMGHRNNQTVKGVNFYGPESEFIVSGSDCGNIFLWDKATENIVKYMSGDDGGVINVLEPHPFSPVLATSGLDHDVKIWAPTGEFPTKLLGLKKLIKRNSREREEERSGGENSVDGAMLWYLMHHLRRGRRRRQREAQRARGESPDGDDDDDSSSETASSNSDSDEESGPHERIQCAPS